MSIQKEELRPCVVKIGEISEEYHYANEDAEKNK